MHNSAQGASQSSDRSWIQPRVCVDIRLLREEVLEGVYTGSGFVKSPSIPNTSSAMSHSDSFLPISRALPPVIIFSVDQRSDWGFDVGIAVRRRLVMNIFSRALKYTKARFTCISVGSGTEAKSSTDTSSAMVPLTVADSGKGFLNIYASLAP